MLSLIWIAIMGFIVGVFTNIIPLLGSSLFNFMLALLITGYQGLANAMNGMLPLVPQSIYVFMLAYFVGTFTIKVLAFIPIPIVQQIAMMFSGTEP